MRKRLFPPTFLVFLVLVGLEAGGQQHEHADCLPEVFVLDSFGRGYSVQSPDRVKRIELGKDYRFRVFLGQRLLRTIALRDLSAGTFIKWSSDSKAFYIMWSNGGMTGRYDVRVFRLHGSRVTEVKVTGKASKDFARRHYCRARGNNLYALGWEQGSERLMLLTAVFPTSDCGTSAGTIAGYLVNARNGRIEERYTEQEIAPRASKCLWGRLPTALTSDEDLRKQRNNQN